MDDIAFGDGRKVKREKILMLYDSDAGDINMVLTGESAVTQPVSMFTEPSFLSLVELLRSGDVTFTNTEMLFHDYEHPPQWNSYPGVTAVYTKMRADPRILEELKWMGFNLICAANNHAYDFGEGGIRTSMRNFKAAGLTYAGIGRDLAEASEPAYLDTRAGRVALLACTDGGPAESIAGPPSQGMRGRPGVMWLRHRTEYFVDRESFEALQRIGEMWRQNGIGGAQDEQDSDGVFHLLGQPMASPYPSTRFALGDRFGFRRIPNENDLAAIIRQVKHARRQADWVIVTMHAHASGFVPDTPGDHTVALAHAAIDAGADVYTGHGPQRDLGIEIYKGKPIIYSLGHFFLQSSNVLRQSTENFWKAGLRSDATPADYYDLRPEPVRNSSIAQVRFADHRLSEVRIHPIDLGNGRSRSTRGRPMPATGENANQVLDNIKAMSAMFGTEVVRDGDTVLVHL